MKKKKSGECLSVKETKSLARLNRVRASRKYRAKEKMEKRLKSQQTTDIVQKDEEIFRLNL